MKKRIALVIALVTAMVFANVSMIFGAAADYSQPHKHKTGQFNDMDAPAFLSNIGPGYSETHLAESNPAMGYDPSYHLPAYLFLGIYADEEHQGFWMPELAYGEVSNISIDLSELPDTSNGLQYSSLSAAIGIESAEDYEIDVQIRIENARIELPGQTISVDVMNDDFTLKIKERSDPGSPFMDTQLVSYALESLGTSELKNGVFKAGVTLLRSDSPDLGRIKALYYSDQKKYDIPDLTPEWFAYLKSEGFKSIRFQVTWYNHTNDETYLLDQAWLERVEELVSLAMEQDLYCLINITWDMSPNYRDTHGLDYDKPGWITLNGDPKVEERFAAVWKQIAEYFKDYDEYLFFESVNEPSTAGYDQHNVPVEYLDNLNRLNQIFVDTVRATGGNNSKRFLLVPPYFHRGSEHALSHFVLPSDNSNHTIVSMNYYNDGPIVDESFTAADWPGNQFPHIKKYLTDKGIGAVFTEAGSEIKENPLDMRMKYTDFIVTEAKKLNIPVIYYGSDSVYDDWWFRLYDRNTFEPFQQEIINILMK